MKATVRSALKTTTLAWIVAASCLSSCTPSIWNFGTQPSTLVIMVESLGFNSFSCGDSLNGQEEALFESFCDESVRFTHAYAPSTMSQPTIASILTGLYPIEHGVRHNGPLSLSAKHETVAELAKKESFRTAFFSGGPPIFRRSGFNQGFDLFDDNVPTSLKQIYRPAGQVVDLFLNWQKSISSKTRYFSFLFLADPQFLDQPTVNELGEVRENSYESQVAEVSESLTRLVREMKQRKIWDTSNVILVGLNGFVSNRRAGEPGATNLFFESTRSALLMKSARKPKEAPFNWKIDSNVSLVDLGTTLIEMFKVGAPKELTDAGAGLPRVSLAQAMVSPTPDWDGDRKIIIESSWPVWKGLGTTRAALRRGPYLYLFDENDQLFNTLTDNLEVSPLLFSEPSVARLRDQFAFTLRELGYVPWKSRANDVHLKAAKVLLAQELWREQQPPDEVRQRLMVLSRRYPEDQELRGWRADLALQNNDWKELREAAGTTRPYWVTVASLNGERKSKQEVASDACSKALFLRQGVPGKNCGDAMAKDLLTGSNEKIGESERARAMESFYKAYASKTLVDRIARAGLVSGDVWDVNAARWADPALSDLMLSLPEYKKTRAAVRTRLASDSR